MAGGVTTMYLVDTLNPTGYSQVLDELVSGSVTKTYTYGLQRISQNQLVSGTWTPTFYGYDGHGSVRFLTSSGGTVGNTYQFDAFGMPIASTGTTANSYLYSGERFDSNLNLYHLRARYYNQAMGRFETMDPYWGMVRNPVTLHKYVYVANNPAHFVDPSGRLFAEDSLLLKSVSVGTLAIFLGIEAHGIFCEVAEAVASAGTGPAYQGLPYVSGPCGCSMRDQPHDEFPGPPDQNPSGPPRFPETFE
jgi:RHS repeat-associated protein